MDRERLKRAAWVGALGIALVVVIALVSGRGSGPGAAQIEPLGPQQLPPVPSAGPAQSIDARSVPPSLIRTATATVIQHVDDKTGTLKRTFIADKLTPRERWEMDVVRPQVLLYLSPSRVIHLVSDAGHFVAPANIPQSGQFTGNLVLTIYDSGSSRPARISEDSDDAVIRLESAEGAVFDATRGAEHRAGPAHRPRAAPGLQRGRPAHRSPDDRQRGRAAPAAARLADGRPG
jgi:hypothetical protein